MSEIGSSGSWNGRRYTPREKEQAVRMVRSLREELGTSQGTIKRVAEQLGYGVESVRVWVKQADVDAGVTPGITSADKARVVALEQEVRELRRANSMADSTGGRTGAVKLRHPLITGAAHGRHPYSRAEAVGLPASCQGLASGRHRP